LKTSRKKLEFAAAASAPAPHGEIMIATDIGAAKQAFLR
jgi:hypothetical protein